MTTFPSKVLRLATVLAAAYAPLSATAYTEYGEVSLFGAEKGEALITPSIDTTQFSPIDLLQTTSTEEVLSSSFPTPELHTAFQEWKSKFARAYETVHENALRKLVWLENHAHIEAHNNQSPQASYTQSHNDFSDLTNDEFRKRFYLGEYSPGIVKPKGRSDGSSLVVASQRNLLRGDLEEGGEEEEEASDTDTVGDVPEEKNWMEEGAVTKVKNQWFCGACWAFSAVGAIEGARYIKTGNLTELSIQQLLDCDMTDLGCGGGLMDQAFQYDEDSVGLCPLSEYPFAYHRHWFYGCRRYMPYCEPLPSTKVSQYVNVTKTEVALKAAIATQPVSVAVSAGVLGWQFYHKGIMSGGCNEQIDHGVLAVGYGHYDPGTDPDGTSSDVAGDYWLVKNSWGETWGLNGYVQLARNVGNEAEGGSSCILTLASRPVMKEED